MANSYGFTGEQQFAEADSLVYLRARYYQPSYGRFISRDPILAPMQRGDLVGWFLPNLDLISKPKYMHPYVYALNDPINFGDPSGLESYKECVYNCLDTMTGGFIGVIISSGTGMAALMAELEGLAKAWGKCGRGAVVVGGIIGAWGTGAGVGCLIGCGIGAGIIALPVETAPPGDSYPPPWIMPDQLY